MNTMKKNLIVILLFTLTLSVNLASAEATSHKVIKVIDGDTVYIDFNDNGIPEQNEKVRINGIDTFETKLNDGLEWQMKLYGLSQDEALGVGYYGKEFAKKELLNKTVRAEYTAEEKFDKNNRHLMSIYYNCNKNGKCNNYEEEVLKAGLATIYTKSNLAVQLKQYENLDKIKTYAKKSHKLNLVLLNNKTGKFHEPDCEYAQYMGGAELVQKKDIGKAVGGQCCINVKPDVIKQKKMSEILSDLEKNNIAIYFVDPLKNKKPVNEPDSDAALALLALINNAKDSINFAIYGIGGQDEIFRALVEAQKRGVKIQGVADVDKEYKNVYSDTFRLISIIKNFAVDFESTKTTEEIERKKYYVNNINIPYKQNIKFDFDNNSIDKTYVTQTGIEIQKGIMHNKFFIIDNQYVWTGSTNVSSGCMTYNSNVSVAVKSKELAKLYTEEFNQMYFNGKFHQNKLPIKNNENISINNETKISVYFSPKNKVFYNAIIPLINKSKSSIDIPMFFLTHKAITQALLDARSRGVKIRVILDAVGAKSAYSKHNVLREAGIPVKIENWGGKMHMKSMIIDNEIIVVGSTNWTSTAAYTNDENLLVIYNKNLANLFGKEFERLYNSIPNKWLKKCPEPESLDSRYSCSDGIDNDHDGLIDKADDSCKIFFRKKNLELNPNQIEDVD